MLIMNEKLLFKSLKKSVQLARDPRHVNQLLDRSNRFCCEMDAQIQFKEVSVLLQNQPGSIKTSYLRQQLLSKKTKTHFYGNCLQLGRENNQAVNRWILCNEQEDNCVRLEDFSKEFSLHHNVVHFFVDNPLLFKPEIKVLYQFLISSLLTNNKEYDQEILVSFMTTSFSTYFFSFPNPRFQQVRFHLSRNSNNLFCRTMPIRQYLLR